jgi:lipoate-protein ligase A
VDCAGILENQHNNKQWRFIDSGALPGAMNMALDMAMTQAVAEARVLPTLRVYRWRPWAISLGYHQSEIDVDLDRCRRNHIDVVMRPTGGRAILHAVELTYAVSIPPSSPFFSQDIQSVYSIISRCLVTSLDLLGINVCFERARKTPKDFARGELSALCYASSVQDEIGIEQRKLVGSAQRRIQGSALQHGSVLIGDEHLAVADYLAAKNQAWRERVKQYMIKNTVSLNQVSQRIVTYEALARALHDGFQSELGIEFVQARISDAELERAWRLAPKFSILTDATYGQ